MGFGNNYLDRNYREFPIVFTVRSDRVPPKTMEIMLLLLASKRRRERMFRLIKSEHLEFQA